MKSIIAGILLFAGLQCALSGRAAAQWAAPAPPGSAMARFLEGHLLCQGSLTAKWKGLGWSIAK